MFGFLFTLLAGILFGRNFWVLEVRQRWIEEIKHTSGDYSDYDNHTTSYMPMLLQFWRWSPKMADWRQP